MGRGERKGKTGVAGPPVGRTGRRLLSDLARKGKGEAPGASGSILQRRKKRKWKGLDHIRPCEPRTASSLRS